MCVFARVARALTVSAAFSQMLNILLFPMACMCASVVTCSHDHLETRGQTCGALSNKLILCVCFAVIGSSNLIFSWFLPAKGLPGVGGEN